MKAILRILLILMVGSVPAWASLGDDVSSVIVDQNALQGHIRIEVHTSYELHEITTPNGSIVREFVSPQGKVFGIAWQGHGIPNLRQLLGSYAPQLQKGQRTRVVPRRAVWIQGDDFVLFSFGYLRFFRGCAYVPSLVPNNVTAEVVQ
jgi:hypothetical protein